jgi:hypothetical protein
MEQRPPDRANPANMKYVRVLKIGTTDRPDSAPGNPMPYPYGGRCATDPSLPVDYELSGWLVQDPTVGEAIEILRCVRNGISCFGYFRSTPVAMVSDGEFHTKNSVYRVVETPFATVSEKSRAKLHPYFSGSD